MNRNKLGMTVDFTRPEGVEVFKRLIKVSDAIVENNSTEVMNKLGIGYEVLREVKPDIIMLRMQAYGLSGPYANYRAYGTDVEAMAGHSMLRGYADTDASLLSAMYPANAAAAMHATFAVLAALHYRNRTGKGQLIEVAMAESVFTFLGQAILDYTLNGRVQKAMGNRGSSAIQGCYRCLGEDNWVCITIATDAEWGGFCRGLGNPLWTREERFADVVGRYRNHDELDKLIEEWTTRHDHFEVMYLLQKEGVAAGPVENHKQAYDDPHLKARGYFEKVTHAETGTHLYPGMNWKMSHAKLRVRLPPVLLGEHNEYVYKHILGISDEEYARLEKEGHIGMDYAPHIL
jgi:crotonobetainyl-CoA:carnitine CoA-transferase CaiB-like acyl-CoA transferase